MNKQKTVRNLCDNIMCKNAGMCHVILKNKIPISECWCLNSFTGYNCEINKKLTGKRTK